MGASKCEIIILSLFLNHELFTTDKPDLSFLSLPNPDYIVCDCECLVVALLIQADMDTSRKTEYFYPILSHTSHDLFKFLPMNYKKKKKQKTSTSIFGFFL